MNIWILNFEPDAGRKALFADLFDGPSCRRWFCEDDDNETDKYRQWFEQTVTDACRIRGWGIADSNFALIHVTRLLPAEASNEADAIRHLVREFDDSWCASTGFVLYSGRPDLGNLYPDLFGTPLTNKNGKLVHLKVLNETINVNPLSSQANRLADLSGLAEAENWREFDRYPLNRDEGDSESVLPLFTALDLLLQCYLEIRDPDYTARTPFDESESTNEGAANQAKEAHTRTAWSPVQRLFRPDMSVSSLQEPGDLGELQEAEEGYYWFDSCLSDVERMSWKEVKVAFSPAASKSNLAAVWNVLRGECLGKEDGTKARFELKIQSGSPDALSQDPERAQQVWTELFRQAHLEYLSFFFPELEKIRVNLSHNRLKHLFTMKLLSSDRASEPEERFRRILRSWEFIRSPANCPEEAAAVRASAQEAIEAWPDLLRDLECFFDETPGRFGLRLTDRGREARSVLGAKVDSPGSRISEFVSNFDEYASQSIDKKLKILAEFGRACDELQDTLTMARHKESSGVLFGGIFELARSGARETDEE